MSKLTTNRSGGNYILAWHLNPVHTIWTKFDLGILHDTRSKPGDKFFIFLKIQDGRRQSKVQKSTQFDPTNHILAWHLDTIHPILTKYGIDILLDHMNKPVDKFLHLLQNPRWPSEVKGKKSSKFGPTNHLSARHLDLIHLIWTKFGRQILLNPRNKLTE